MNVFRMALRSLTLRKTSTTLTATGVALGVMLVTSVLVLEHQVRTSYSNQGSGFPIVVGAKGSPLQLVLNTVYHVDRSPGLMPFRTYRELAAQNWVKLAVPYALGDAFHGFRVVATTDAIFDPSFRPLPDLNLTIKEGRPLHSDTKAVDAAILEIEEKAKSGAFATTSQPAEEHDHHEGTETANNEAVIGSVVADKLGLKIGDKIEPTHGVEGGKAHEHEETWTVVGIMAQTATAIDRVVFINLESFYGIDEHQAGAVIPNTTDVGLSSVIVVPKSAIYKAMMLPALNKRADIQAVSPAEEIRKLLTIVGRIDRIFLFVAIITVVVSLIGVAVALFNTMNERRREIAILRAIGARRGSVLAQVVGEATAIGVAGGLVGLLLCHLLIRVLSGSIAEASGFTPTAFGWTPLFTAEGAGVGSGPPAEVAVLVGVFVVCALAGLLPAISAHRTDVASNLVPTS
jgi:putative ABC transport system permease protein